MSCRRITNRRSIRARFRRGFALPLVILLLLVSGMTIVVIMQRQTSQSKLVEEMVGDYQSHHAAFGVRAIVRKWMNQKSGRELAEFAAKEDVSYRFILPNDLYVSIWIQDGQGMPVAAPVDIGPTNLTYYRDIIERTRQYSNRPIRPRGPSAISIGSAPRSVLKALVEDEEQGDRLAQRIIDARQRRPLDRDELMNQLRRSGLADDEIARIIAISTFDPILWRVNVFSDDRKHRIQRYFVMQADVIGGAASVNSWEEITGNGISNPFEENPGNSNRENDDSADLNENNRSSSSDSDDGDARGTGRNKTIERRTPTR